MRKQKTPLFIHCNASHPSQEGLRPKFTEGPYKSELHEWLQAKAITLKMGPATTLFLTPRRLGSWEASFSMDHALT